MHKVIFLEARYGLVEAASTFVSKILQEDFYYRDLGSLTVGPLRDK